MKSSHSLVFASLVAVLAILWLAFRFLPVVESSGPLFVQMSIPKGDLLPDERSPEDACLPYLANVQADHDDWVCSLSEAVSVDSFEDNSMELCVDGMSVAGCFACRFVCEAPVAAQ